MNEDVAGLVERLEAQLRANRVNCYADGKDRFTVFDVAEAASTIRALDAENERLQEELQSTAMEALTAQGQAWEASARIDAAEAKLREAVEVLGRVLEWAEAVAGDTRFVAEAAEEVASVEAARAFLSTMEKPND